MCDERDRARYRRRATTAIYAHLDDNALQFAAAQAAGVIGKAMGFRAEAPSLPDEAEGVDADSLPASPGRGQTSTAPSVLQEPLWLRAGHEMPDQTQSKHGPADRPRNPIMECPASASAVPDRSLIDDENQVDHFLLTCDYSSLHVFGI